MTKTRIAQITVNVILTAKISRFTREAIATHTKYDDESIPAIAGGVVVSGIVTSKTEPITDAKIAEIADWFTAKKEARNNNK
jgi:xanthine/uracil permease